MRETQPVAEALAERIASLDAARLPPQVRETCERLLIDVIGLCVVARATDYVRAALSAWSSDAGRATAIGHPGQIGAAAAAFVNGTAAHGEDFDDTFEGGPVHAGAVVVPAVLAAAEQERRGGTSALLGIAVGVETICRLSLVVPKAVHKAGFHPTAVFGAPAAAAGAGAAMGLEPRQLADALGVAGSMASGIIEYLAEGTWTKRMHPGWAAQSGLRAALLGRAGFSGPRTVLEGVHGLYAAFARSNEGNYSALLDGFGERWLMTALAFKPYPCGTMIQPYVDCARRLGKRVVPKDVIEVVASVAEGTVHRLWEPLAEKQRPPNGYAAKFSAPWCIAAGLLHGNLGLDAFADAAVADPSVRSLAAKVRYEIDAANPYPFEYTGHLRARATGGAMLEERQPHLRGGARDPLTRADIEEKFRSNTRAGGWPDDRIASALALARTLWDGAVDLSVLRG
ncbi:MAG TPA: MmgE/PrpD family protein [Myxococcales bacterium]|nr:MmgE/PrpD family protein [Myxococcales bacterium]